MFSREQRRDTTRVAKKIGLYGLVGVLALGLLAALMFVGVGLLARKIADDNNEAKSQQSQSAPSTSTGEDPVPSAPPSTESEDEDNSPLRSKVVRIIDGDTIVVEATDRLLANGSNPDEHIVRILGINAPELNTRSLKDAECGAEEATRGMQVIARVGNEVELTYDERSDRTDRYGRTLAYVTTADNTDVGSWMVERGYVMPYYPKSEPEPQRVPQYEKLADQAKEISRGSHAYCTLK